jgi:DNA-binding beta-propeller fold protein YncE
VSVIRNTEVITTLTSGASPSSIAIDPITGYSYVCNFYENNVTVIRGTQIIGKVSVIQAPRMVKVNPKTGLAYVIGSNSPTISVISGTQVIATPTMRWSAKDVAFDPNSDNIYVIDEYGVAILQGETVHAYIQLGDPNHGDRFSAIAFSVVSGHVYAVNQQKDSVAVINGGQLVATLPTGTDPSAIEADPASGWIYVANAGSHDVTVISDTQVINTIPLETSPSIVALGRSLQNIVIDPHSGALYVANYYRHTISVLTIEPDFNVVPDQTVWLIRVGSQITRTVQLAAQQGFTQPVSLVISGLPSSSMATFSPNPAPPTSTIVVTIAIPQEIPERSYALTLSGEGGGIAHQVQILLIVYSDQSFLPVISRNYPLTLTPVPTAWATPTPRPTMTPRPP